MKHIKKTTVLFGMLISSISAMSQTLCVDVTNFADLGSAISGACSTPVGSGASKRTDKNLYMGLVWSFGQKASKTPDVLIGLRSIEVNSSNKVSGADLSLRLQSAKNFAPEGVRLSLLGGHRDSLANIGAGYSFSANQALLTGAVQSSHLRVGTDYLLANKTLVPYIELNSLKRIKPAGTSLTCPSGDLRTVDQNIAINGLTSPTSNGLFTADAASSAQMVDFFGPYLPAGSKTCFGPVPESE